MRLRWRTWLGGREGGEGGVECGASMELTACDLEMTTENTIQIGLTSELN